MFVVENCSMMVDCVLGKDFLSRVGLILVAAGTLHRDGDSGVVSGEVGFVDP